MLFIVLFSSESAKPSKSSVAESSEASKWGASTEVEILVLIVLLTVASKAGLRWVKTVGGGKSKLGSRAGSGGCSGEAEDDQD